MFLQEHHNSILVHNWIQWWLVSNNTNDASTMSLWVANANGCLHWQHKWESRPEVLEMSWLASEFFLIWNWVVPLIFGRHKIWCLKRTCDLFIWDDKFGPGTIPMVEVTSKCFNANRLVHSHSSYNYTVGMHQIYWSLSIAHTIYEAMWLPHTSQ